MTAAQDPHGHGPAEFDRIVSRLRAEDPGFADQRRFAPPIQPPIEPKMELSGRTAPDDGPFVLASLAVILAMSMVVGGWIGLMAMLVSVVVAARLTLHAVVDQQR